MMLFVVPPVTRVIVMTAGSNTSTRRVTAVWRARISSAATVIGSSGEVRRGRVATAPTDRGHDPVRGREHRAAAQRDRARGIARADVERDGARDVGLIRPVGAVEQPFVEHDLGAVVALLARLEHQQDVALELVAPLDEQASRAQQHRDVRVVPAGVHRAIDLGREVEPGVLVQGQGVHVGPKQGRAAGPAALDRRRHRRRSRARAAVPARDRRSASAITAWVSGSCSPISGRRWMPTAHLDDVGEDRLGGGQEPREVDGGRVGHGMSVRPAAAV